MSGSVNMWEKLRRDYKAASAAPEEPELYDPWKDPDAMQDMAEELAARLEFGEGLSRKEAERIAFSRLKEQR
jgi:hypothetical protein